MELTFDNGHQSFTDLIVYQISGMSTSTITNKQKRTGTYTERRQDIANSVTKWIQIKLIKHRNERIAIMGDLNEIQFPHDRNPPHKTNKQRNSFSIHQVTENWKMHTASTQ